MDKITESVVNTFDSQKDRLYNISKEIWSHPERSFQETQAHKLLTDFLVEQGFDVEKGFIAATGFRAVYSADKDGGGDAGKKPNVVFFCEYDAVADLGHAAGHNLKCSSSLGAALAIRDLIKSGNLPGTVTVLGTPGEDCGEGVKIDMMNARVFDDVDFCMMLTPMNRSILFPKHYALAVVSVTYKGKAAHASAFPWEGRNALDAAVACYNNIALVRQQLKPDMSINGVILNGGTQANLIPPFSEMKFWLRAADHAELFILKQKCTACFVAAGKATGCEADFVFEDKIHNPMEHNRPLGEIFAKHAANFGLEFVEEYPGHTGSTDMGNVSQIVPCLSPAYDIGTHVALNSLMFQAVSGTPEAEERTLKAAKVMACTAAEVLHDPELMAAVRDAKSHGASACTEIMHRLSVSSVEDA